MKLVYIAGPYSADTPAGMVQNIRNAEAVAIKYWQKGFAVICPHKNTALLDGTCPGEVWYQGDIVMLKRCDAIVMMTNWRDSPGAVNEHDIAIESGLEVIYDEDY